MALYVSKAQRLRRTVIVAAVSALVASGIGWLFGRQQVPSVDSQVAAAKERGELIATGIERLDIEYEQVLGGAPGETMERGVLAPLDDVRAELQRAMDDAPWITSAQRSAALDQLATVRGAAESTVALERFRSALQRAGSVIRATFGVVPAGSTATPATG